MAANMSLSDSVRASVIVSQQVQSHQEALQQRLGTVSTQGVSTSQRHPQQQQQQQQQHQTEELRYRGEGVSWGLQLLLTSSGLGMEMCIAFEAIYVILSLQYLGVPLELTTLYSIASGGFSVLILPFVGIWTDRGQNPMRRKLVPVLAGGVIYVMSHCIFILAVVVKITSTNTEAVNRVNVTAASSTSVPGGDGASYGNSTVRDDDAASGLPLVPEVMDGLPVSGVIGILGAILIDVGYDMSMTVTRALILEVVPTYQHTRVLVTTTVLSGMGGIALSTLGVFDLPALLGPVLHLDGTAAMLVLLCSLQVIIVTLTYGCSLFVASALQKNISKSSQQRYLAAADGKKVKAEKNDKDTKDNSRERKKKRHVPTSFLKNCGGTEVQPLLVHNEQEPHSADGIRPFESSSSLAQSQNSVYGGTRHTVEACQETSVAMSHNSIGGYGWKVKSSSTENTGEDPDKTSATVDITGNHSGAIEYEDESKASTFPFSDIFQGAISSMSVSTTQSEQTPLGDFHNRKLAQLQTKKESPILESSNMGKNTARGTGSFSRPLLCLLFLLSANFCSTGALTTLTVFASNTLVIEIYQGDPAALPGSEEYRMYQEGMLVASLGTVIYYVTYFMASSVTRKTIEILGARMLFLSSSVVLGAVCVLFISTARVDVYYVTMACAGLNKCMLYTAPFLLAVEFSQRGVTDPGSSSSNLGRVTSYIGVLTPGHYILIGCLMGPLMDYFHSAWAPVYYVVIHSALAAILVVPLFLFKKVVPPDNSSSS